MSIMHIVYVVTELLEIILKLHIALCQFMHLYKSIEGREFNPCATGIIVGYPNGKRFQKRF